LLETLDDSTSVGGDDVRWL
jgi:hypothetical protein